MFLIFLNIAFLVLLIMSRTNEVRVLILVLMFALCTPASADDWTTEDTQREVAYMVLHSMDWAQTRNIARNPARYYEYNSLIGEHPSVGRVDGYMATSALLHVGITAILPTEYRSAFQYFTIAFKAGLVQHNFSAGISANF